ncbi:MAG: hypothetical protein HC836_45405 [Richelia sp. RM2_1_2]|nr:hypothetical protein [Richelia sp. SM1_7_0]NJN13404.1 hypothetical protein [Richelia sp. RM1_1_1]NJO65097.1 hypothetical protein [Richelia sp. RM2_1_2]
MKNQLIFILKVLLLSWAISVFIKYIAPNLSIPETATNALIIVLLPNLIVAAVLLGQLFRKPNIN